MENIPEQPTEEADNAAVIVTVSATHTSGPLPGFVDYREVVQLPNGYAVREHLWAWTRDENYPDNLKPVYADEHHPDLQAAIGAAMNAVDEREQIINEIEEYLAQSQGEAPQHDTP